MPITTLFLLPLLFLLPGLALTVTVSASPEPRQPGRDIGITDLFFISIALTGWAAQTLALAGLFTLPLVAATVTLPSLAALLIRRGPRTGLTAIRRLALDATRPSAVAVAAALAVLLLACLLYRPPGVALLGDAPAPAFHGLGLHLARQGALIQPGSMDGLSWATEALREAAASGLFFPGFIGLLGLLGGAGVAAGAPALFAALSLAALFRIGRQVTGSAWFGAGLLLVLGLNYPQAWLARVSVPESAAQFLVLSSALFFLRSRQGARTLPAAAVCLGAAQLCSPALLWLTPPALLLLLALHAGGPAVHRRQALRFSLWVLPFLAQGWFQALLLGPSGHLPPAPVGSAHWMVWYLTLPFVVLLGCGLLMLLARPAATLKLATGLGPLFPLALVSIPFLWRHPGSAALQPWAVRPFTMALIPACLLVSMLFFHGALQWLRHPALRLIWFSSLALLLGLNLANLMPMATAQPGHGARRLVEQAAEPLTAPGKPYTAVVEPGPGSLCLHTALAGSRGISAAALRGDALDDERFQAVVLGGAAAGRRTALVVDDGVFTPDPAVVTLRPLARAAGNLRLLPPETEHLPSTVVIHTMRLQIFEALPASENDYPAGGSTLEVRVGIYGDDWPFLAHGFHGCSAAGERSYRWTGPRARLRVPAWAEGVSLTLGGFRPPGAPAAQVSVGFAGDPGPLTRRLPREGFVSIFVPRPTDAGGREAALLELRSSTFRPDPWFTGSNGELLGLQLAAVTFHFPEQGASIVQ